MKARFYLLGQCDSKNPKSIPKEKIETWHNENIITYLGISDDVREFIKYASAIVLPSYYKEGVPRVLLESMAMSKPIITTNTTGCKDLVAIKSNLRNDNFNNDFIVGNNGFLVFPKNINSLYSAIVAFTNAKNKDLMQKASLEESKKYNQDFIVDIYLKKIFGLQSKKQSGKKIIFVSNSCFGMYNFRLKVLQNIKQNGYEIHIIAPFDKTTQNLIDEGFYCYDIFIDPKSINPLKDLRFLFSLRKIIKQINPNLIFNYTIKPVIYGSFIANQLKIQNIAVTTGLGYVFIPSGFFKKILKNIVIKLYKYTLKNTGEIWFLNKDDRDEFINLKIIDSKKSFILPSEGVDLHHFKINFEKKANFKAQNKAQEDYLNIPPKDDEIRFLLIARMLWDKGIGEFVEVARMHQKINKISQN